MPTAGEFCRRRDPYQFVGKIEPRSADDAVIGVISVDIIVASGQNQLRHLSGVEIRLSRDSILSVINSNTAPDVALADVAVLPRPIHPLEPAARKPLAHLIAEDQVRLGHLSVFLLVPCFAHQKVSKEIIRHLRRYLPLFRQLSEFRLAYASRADWQFEKATEIFHSFISNVGFEWNLHEIREPLSPIMDIGERHHRRRRNHEHAKLVDEIPNRRNARFAAQIEARWKKMLPNVQGFTEEAKLFRFRFQVLVLLVQ